MEDAEQVIPLYIWSPDEESPWEPGGASRWWLHHSLKQLASDMEQRDNRLIIRSGPCQKTLESLLSESESSGVYWNRLYDPKLVERDKSIKKYLKEAEFEVKTFPGAILKEPWEVVNGSGKPYQVFTPFWKKLRAEYQHSSPLPKPREIPSPRKHYDSLALDELKLLPETSWDKDFYSTWQPGEQGAKEALADFISNKIAEYQQQRDKPAEEGTSLLAAHLHFGELTPRQVWEQVDRDIEKGDLSAQDAEPYLRQLGWRDFSHQLLFNFPETDTRPLRREFESFPWKMNASQLKAWQKGLTGYPVVDAGMRQLWKTGTMHNRVRMIVASLLVKHLLIPWQEGAKWFWDTLVDADLANNTMGWQWTAGCGADAAPYFRVFNPILQGEKFDPEGDYVRLWVPELGELPKKWIHRPWEASEKALKEAGIELGDTYPRPIIEHQEGREQALEAYDELKEETKGK